MKQGLIANNITSFSKQTWDFFCLYSSWHDYQVLVYFLSSKLPFWFSHHNITNLLPPFLIVRPTCFDTFSCLQCLYWIPVPEHILHYFTRKCIIRTEEQKFQVRHFFIWTVPGSHLHNLYLKLKLSHERILLWCLTIIY